MIEADIERIKRLPRKNCLVAANSFFQRTESDMKLFSCQLRALQEAYYCNGLLGAIGVGKGKTLIWCLLPYVLNSHSTLVLVPPGALAQAREMIYEYRKHWKVLNIELFSYGKLSRPEGEQLLRDHAPDLVIADEAHYLGNPRSARTQRVKRFLVSNPKIRFVALSGTMIKKSILDYWHLAEWALRELNPLPRKKRLVLSLAELVDYQGDPRSHDWRIATKLGCTSRSALRAWYSDHLEKTAGVVVEQGVQNVDSSLYLTTVRSLSRNSDLDKLRKKCLEEGMDLQGNYFIEPSHSWAFFCRLALGFAHFEVWPEGENPGYKVARNAWAAAVRWEIDRCGREGYDSPLLVENSIRGGRSTAPAWVVAALDRWRTYRGGPKPAIEARWITTSILEQALERCDGDCLIWYHHRAVARKLEELGVTVRYAGQKVDVTRGQIGLSIRSHGIGLNLQTWSKNMVLEPPSSAGPWEQLLARTHRVGQLEDVHAYVLAHEGVFTRNIRKAKENAKAIGQGKIINAIWNKE